MPASAAIQFSVFKDMDISSPIYISYSKIQIKNQKTIGIQPLSYISPTITNGISKTEAITIALANGVSEDPCCPGIDAQYDKIKISGKWIIVWRVSGPCGKVVYIDKNSGIVVASDGIMCSCDCVI
jgi:hypothetical protein